mmetsp:Transcript_15806/g.22086  ORF Transcript_15806/g.22086 Transcript_15806/m.22086 type:complete len:170 (+) Transcript_15806:47-556(+)
MTSFDSIESLKQINSASEEEQHGGMRSESARNLLKVRKTPAETIPIDRIREMMKNLGYGPRPMPIDAEIENSDAEADNEEDDDDDDNVHDLDDVVNEQAHNEEDELNIIFLPDDAEAQGGVLNLDFDKNDDDEEENYTEDEFEENTIKFKPVDEKMKTCMLGLKKSSKK